MNTKRRKRRTHERARAAARLARSVAAVRSAGPLGFRLRAARSVLLVVDVHERLVPAIADSARVIERCGVLLRAASMLAVPVLMSEHCPLSLGPAVAPLRSLMQDADIVSKSHFSCADEPALAQRIATFARPQIVVAGLEAHVCVLQSALGFAERGYRVYVVADATASREREACETAMQRLRMAEVSVVTTEMVLFEWLERADRAQLRELLALIK
jgi:nicotinamidase-related amidase